MFNSDRSSVIAVMVVLYGGLLVWMIVAITISRSLHRSRRLGVPFRRWPMLLGVGGLLISFVLACCNLALLLYAWVSGESAPVAFWIVGPALILMLLFFSLLLFATGRYVRPPPRSDEVQAGLRFRGALSISATGVTAGYNAFGLLVLLLPSWIGYLDALESRSRTPNLSLIALGTLVIGILEIAVISAISRGTQQIYRSTLLQLLALCTKRGLPLTDTLRAWGEGCSFRWRDSLQTLALRLDEGVSLPEALERSPRLLAPEIVATLRVAAETRTVSTCLQELSQQEILEARTQSVAEWTLKNVLLYGVLLFLLGIGAVNLVGLNLVKIAQGYGRYGEGGGEPPLPKAAERLQALLSYSGGPELLLLIIMLVLLFWWVRVATREKSLLAPFVRSNRKRYTSHILRTLARTVSQEQSVVKVLALLAVHTRARSARLALARALGHVEQGRETWGALRSAGLINEQEQRLLTSAERARNLPWGLELVAERLERQRNHRWYLSNQILQPALIVMFGVFVLFIGHTLLQFGLMFPDF